MNVLLFFHRVSEVEPIDCFVAGCKGGNEGWDRIGVEHWRSISHVKTGFTGCFAAQVEEIVEEPRRANMAGHHQPGELIKVDGRGLMIVDEPPVFPSRFHRTSICIYSIWHGGDHHFAKDPQGVPVRRVIVDQPRIPSLPLLTQHPQLKS